MGNDTLVTRANGQIIDADHINLFNRVLEADFVGRDSSGAPASGQNLGTITVPWGTARITSLILNGSAIDAGLLTSSPNRVISGAVRSTSEFPDYLRPAGAGNGAQFTVRGSTTTLAIDVDGVAVDITTDIIKSGLTVAPAANNTCQINDTGLTGTDDTKYLGEDGTSIPVDSMGTNLTAEIGNFVTLLNQTTNEIMYAYVKSSTLLTNVRRGYYFNSSANPVTRDVLLNNDVLQLLSTAWIFAEDDALTIDVTYNNPAIGGTEPGSPATGDYWFDTALFAWKRYNGASFVSISRTFIGIACLDTSDCIGTRPQYYTKTYGPQNNARIKLNTTDIISLDEEKTQISIDGADLTFDFNFMVWNSGSNFESGVSRTASTYYYIYITEKGRPIISDKKPYDERGFLKGWYHPHDSFRYIGKIYNNSSNEFIIVDPSDEILEQPIGSVIELAYDDGAAPEGYLRTDGSSLSTLSYSALFHRLGYDWGGSGSSFSLPDDRGVFMRGLDDGRGLDSGRSWASYQADAVETITGYVDLFYISSTARFFRGYGGAFSTGNAISGTYYINTTVTGSYTMERLTFSSASSIGASTETIVKNNTKIYAIKYK